MTLKLWRPG